MHYVYFIWVVHFEWRNCALRIITRSCIISREHSGRNSEQCINMVKVEGQIMRGEEGKRPPLSAATNPDYTVCVSKPLPTFLINLYKRRMENKWVQTLEVPFLYIHPHQKQLALLYIYTTSSLYLIYIKSQIRFLLCNIFLVLFISFR